MTNVPFAPLRFVSLVSEPGLDRYRPQVVGGIHEAASPYVDWFFGDVDAARDALTAWISRSSSEVAAQRITLAVLGEQPVGGFIALSGSELDRCRRADAVAAVAQVGRDQRAALQARIRQTQGLFPPVEDEATYLSKIWVAPEARGKGHGQSLLREYLAAGRRNQAARFRLDVSSDNHVAIRLYQAFGFVIAGTSAVDDVGIRYSRLVRDDEAVMERPGAGW